jgi:hypothetical protein
MTWISWNWPESKELIHDLKLPCADKLRQIEKQNYRLLMRLRYIHKNYSLYMPKKHVYLSRGEAGRWVNFCTHYITFNNSDEKISYHPWSHNMTTIGNFLAHIWKHKQRIGIIQQGKKTAKKPAKSEETTQAEAPKPHNHLVAEEMANRVAAVNLWKTWSSNRC